MNIKKKKVEYGVYDVYVDGVLVGRVAKTGRPGVDHYPWDWLPVWQASAKGPWHAGLMSEAVEALTDYYKIDRPKPEEMNRATGWEPGKPFKEVK